MINKIIDLFKKENYFSFLEIELLKANNHFLKIHEIPIDVLKDNLTIGIKSSNVTGKNVSDLILLLESIYSIPDDYIYAIDVLMPNKGLKTLYISKNLNKILGNFNKSTISKIIQNQCHLRSIKHLFKNLEFFIF